MYTIPSLKIPLAPFGHNLLKKSFAFKGNPVENPFRFKGMPLVNGNWAKGFANYPLNKENPFGSQALSTCYKPFETH